LFIFGWRPPSAAAASLDSAASFFPVAGLDSAASFVPAAGEHSYKIPSTSSFRSVSAEPLAAYSHGDDDARSSRPLSVLLRSCLTQGRRR
jgi:hypothetical protein